LKDLEGKKIATRLGSTSSKFIKDNIDNADAKEYEQLDQAYLAVENGSVDAVLYDWPNVAYYIETKGDSLKMVGDKYEAENYGIAFAKGQEDLVNAVDEALETLKDNGKYDEIYEEWFVKKKKKQNKAIDEANKTLKDNGKYDEIYEEWFGKKDDEDDDK